MSLYLFRREARGAVPDCWGDIETIYHDIEHLFDHLQTIYRPMPITVVRSPLEDLIDHHVPKWRSWFESRGRTLQLDRPDTRGHRGFRSRPARRRARCTGRLEGGGRRREGD